MIKWLNQYNKKVTTEALQELQSIPKRDSLKYAIARDKLIDMRILPDDPIADPTDDYLNSFKPKDKQH